MVLKSEKNYYEILQVTPDSDLNEVKSSFRKLASIYHPDVNKSPDSIEKFKAINEAYRVLSDEKKRKQYDMLNGIYRTPKYATWKNKTIDEEPISNESAEEPASESISSAEKFLKDVINDIIDGIKTQKKTKKAEKLKAQRGDDITTDVNIRLSEAITGTERTINVLHTEVCKSCEGRKFINGAKCSSCGGSGEHREHRKITVKIPQGVKDGTKLRIANEGNSGVCGGKSGDLYVKVHLEKDSEMRVEGEDIYYHLPITPFEAVLGTKIDLPQCCGLRLTIPEMTKSGQKFRLTKQGLRSNNHVGDMIIIVEIQIPKNLSDDEKKLYEKLRKLSTGDIRVNDEN